MPFDSPIFVTGMPRSGTTLLQHWLSQHPRIAIYGQEPTACAWGEWLQTLLNGVDFTRESNERLEYEVPHYAAPTDRDAVAGRLLDYIKWYLTGGVSTPRWGAKSLTQCRMLPDTILKHWPDTRWIVCIRDPFRSIESLRNTFDPEGTVSLETTRQWWLHAVRFAHGRPEALPVLADQLTTEDQRQQAAECICQFVGEAVTDEMRQFATDWPVVHKVVADGDRQFRLEETERGELLSVDPDLAQWAERLGYLTDEEVPV